MAETALPSSVYEILTLDHAAAARISRRTETPPATHRDSAAQRRTTGLGGMIGRAPAMLDLYRRLEKASHGSGPVLIEGATGTGKRLVASTLHALGPNAAGPFVAIDGASLESRLGNVLAGLLAQGQQRSGTLFIDEVTDLPVEAQRDLWRLLETSRRRPPLSTPGMRIVCASSHDLRTEVERGALREDLYARLRGSVLSVPRLRDRLEDLPLLVDHFLAEAQRHQDRRIAGFSPAALELLRTHPWDGNVRELRNEVERAVILTPDGQAIEPRALSPDLRPAGASRGPTPASLKQRSRALEKKMLSESLQRHRWNVAATARELGISRVGLSKKLRTLDLKRPPRSPRLGG